LHDSVNRGSTEDEADIDGPYEPYDSDDGLAGEENTLSLQVTSTSDSSTYPRLGSLDHGCVLTRLQV
jgi:hypothetical protein